MNVGSPAKRRGGIRRPAAEPPMRTTRSMAHIAGTTDSFLDSDAYRSTNYTRIPAELHGDLEASDGLSDTDDRDPLQQAFRNSLTERQKQGSRPRAFRSPEKPASRDDARWCDFGPDSPRVQVQPKMESPKKGRLDDFEFELEHSRSEAPSSLHRYRSVRSGDDVEEQPRPSPMGLPRSRVDRHLGDRSVQDAPSSTTVQQANLQRSPTKKVASRRPQSPQKPLTVPNPFKLADSSRGEKPAIKYSNLPKRAHATVSPSPSDESVQALGSRKEEAPSSRSHIYKSFKLAPEPPDRELQNPFKVQTISSFSRADAETASASSRKSPVKEQDGSPSRKPINLLTLRPSPGKARRGMYRHDDDDDSGEAADVPASVPGEGEDQDEYLLTPGPLPNSSSRRRISSSRISSAPRDTIKPSASSQDVKGTLSTETSDALASLEASLARLSASSHRKTSSSAKKEEDGSCSALPPKRTLGDNRPKALSPSKVQNAGEQNVTNDKDDDGVFKKSTSASTFVTRSRIFLQQRRQQSEQAQSDNQSDSHPFGDANSSRRVDRSSMGPPPPPAERSTEIAAPAPDTAQLAAEARRKAALKAARRKSMHSILSFGSGMPSALVKKEAETSSALTDSSFTSNAGGVSKEGKSSDEARKVARATRRRSMYTYMPTKRDGSDAGDRSVGNVSSGLIIGSAAAALTETEAGAPITKKEMAAARFLRGLTVLVDVRDQDGEDASARWIEMLKNAGAKVMVRFGERQLTHIVYKSGKPSTLHSYRSLPEPKPLVVGVSWIVKCLEEGKRVDEEPYIVEVGKQAIFQKRRRSSMAPRQAPVTTSPPRPPLKSDVLKEVELARQKLLAHAPAVPSPLRWRCYLATQQTSSSNDDDNDDEDNDGLSRYNETVTLILGKVPAVVK